MGSARVKIDPRKTRSYNGDYMRIGKLAESVIWDWLSDHPQVIGLDDLTGLRPLQNVEADFTVATEDGRRSLVEIKHDEHLGKSGNIVVEVLRINHKAPEQAAGVLGWSLRTQASWVLYYSPHLAYVYQFHASDLRVGFQRYTDEARNAAQFIWINTDRIKSTLNVLVPLKYYAGMFEVHDVQSYAMRHQPADYTQLRMKYESPLFGRAA